MGDGERGGVIMISHHPCHHPTLFSRPIMGSLSKGFLEEKYTFGFKQIQVETRLEYVKWSNQVF